MQRTPTASRASSPSQRTPQYLGYLDEFVFFDADKSDFVQPSEDVFNRRERRGRFIRHVASNSSFGGRAAEPNKGFCQKNLIQPGKSLHPMDELRIQASCLRVASELCVFGNPVVQMVSNEPVLIPQQNAEIAEAPIPKSGQRSIRQMAHKRAHGRNVIVGYVLEQLYLKTV